MIPSSQRTYGEDSGPIQEVSRSPSDINLWDRRTQRRFEDLEWNFAIAIFLMALFCAIKKIPIEIRKYVFVIFFFAVTGTIIAVYTKHPFLTSLFTSAGVWLSFTKYKGKVFSWLEWLPK